MTAESIYWITRLTEIKDVIVGTSTIGFIIAAFSAFPYVIACIIKALCYDKECDDYRLASTIGSIVKKPMIIAFVIAISLQLSNTFIPTTKEYFAIKALPVICTHANIDKAKNIMPDALDAASEYIKSLKSSK